MTDPGLPVKVVPSGERGTKDEKDSFGRGKECTSKAFSVSVWLQICSVSECPDLNLLIGCSSGSRFYEREILSLTFWSRHQKYAQWQRSGSLQSQIKRN